MTGVTECEAPPFQPGRFPKRGLRVVGQGRILTHDLNRCRLNRMLNILRQHQSTAGCQRPHCKRHPETQGGDISPKFTLGDQPHRRCHAARLSDG